MSTIFTSFLATSLSRDLLSTPLQEVRHLRPSSFSSSSLVLHHQLVPRRPLPPSSSFSFSSDLLQAPLLACLEIRLSSSCSSSRRYLPEPSTPRRLPSHPSSSASHRLGEGTCRCCAVCSELSGRHLGKACRRLEEVGYLFCRRSIHRCGVSKLSLGCSGRAGSRCHLLRLTLRQVAPG